MIPSDFAGAVVELHIAQGRNLVAKDRTFGLVGKKTASDPYVMLFIDGHLWGRTKTTYKTLSPVWDYKLRIDLDELQARKFLADKLPLKLLIYDEDDNSADDPMGTVLIRVDLSSDKSTQWYPVEKGSGPDMCHNATGEVEVSYTCTVKKMISLVRGNSHQIRYHTIQMGLSWDIEHGQQVDLDASCVAINSSGQVILKDTIYYGNLANTNRSVYHSGDDTTGSGQSDDEVITCHLDRIPANILALYLILTVATPNKTLAGVKSARVRIYNADGPIPSYTPLNPSGQPNLSVSTTRSARSLQPICLFEPSTLGRHTAMFLCRLSRSPEKGPGQWVLSPIQTGDSSARDFGTLIPQVKALSRDLIPNISIDPNERVAVMRKNGMIRLRDYVPARTLPPRLTFGLAWDVTNGTNIDLDASALCLDQDLNTVDLIYFGHLMSKDGAIQHCGDEREGDAVGDDEKINLSLDMLDPVVQYVAFVVNSYSGQELDDVSQASCHLFDTERRTDIAVYSMSCNRSLDKHTALVMACLYRNHGDWLMHIISEPAQGRTARDNVDEVQNFLRRVPPPVVASTPADMEEQEIDLQMPAHIPHQDEEEIILIPASEYQEQLLVGSSRPS